MEHVDKLGTDDDVRWLQAAKLVPAGHMTSSCEFEASRCLCVRLSHVGRGGGSVAGWILDFSLTCGLLVTVENS